MPIVPTLPFWFRQRQGKAEAVEPGVYRLTAPNLAEAFIGIRQAASGRWLPSFKESSNGPELAAASEDFATPQEAWEASFECYRLRIVV